MRFCLESVVSDVHFVRSLLRRAYGVLAEDLGANSLCVHVEGARCSGVSVPLSFSRGAGGLQAWTTWLSSHGGVAGLAELQGLTDEPAFMTSGLCTFGV
jgi:hypothetical protein